MASAAALRMRRYRQRGPTTWVVPVEVDFDGIDWLIESNFLDAALSEDRQAIGAALARLLQKNRYA